MAEMSALIFFLCVRQQRDRKWPRMHLASRIRTGSFVGKNGDPTKRERTSVDMISGWLAAAGGWRLAAGGWRLAAAECFCAPLHGAGHFHTPIHSGVRLDAQTSSNSRKTLPSLLGGCGLV